MGSLIVLACLQAEATRAADTPSRREPDPAVTALAVADARRATSAVDTAPARGAPINLVANGSFSAQPNPLAFWTNAPGAFVVWVSDGANGSQGATHVRFLPPVSRGVGKRGAVYYTGLTQCVPVPRPGRYLLEAYARVPVGASASSIAGVGWTLRFNGAGCTGDADSNGRATVARSSAWTKSFDTAIVIDAADWTAATTLALAIEVGDSSTASVEPVEALMDEISLVEGPLFADGFEP